MCIPRVVQEDAVHRAADGLVAAEAERQVRHAARDVHPGAAFADRAHRFEEVETVTLVLLDAGGDSEDVGIKDDVGRREAVRR